MRITAACFAVALAASAAMAQTKSQREPKSDTAKTKNEAITLSGCVVRSETSPAQYTLADKSDGTTYRLTGVDFRQYIGRAVVVVGSGSKKLAIVGGLTPNPNVAAQAGAIDPARAAVEAQTTPAPSANPNVIEFKVKSIRPSAGSCPEQPK
ncbi:MAG TPA: hypothetical protein VKD69_19775 [Vicinamibacterales bacterium]|nr:hypothetical protein [Vicinamibacterales bacterium]